MNDKVTEKWSSMKEIQKHLGVGRDSILHWIETRDMPAYKLGRLWKFKLSEVDEWIRSGGADERYDEQDEK
ncbi:MAG: helix-turn-helix domain-containing protein [Parabacteroides sp.]|nr:helix-turn-helix domain-containing protein [Parabacteroides sp.]